MSSMHDSLFTLQKTSSPRSPASPTEGKRKKAYQKWKLSLSKGGKAASIVPVFEHDPLVESFTSPIPGTTSGQMMAANALGTAGTDASPLPDEPQVATPRRAPTEINLSKVAGNSLFQRRRSRMEAGG